MTDFRSMTDLRSQLRGLWLPLVTPFRDGTISHGLSTLCTTKSGGNAMPKETGMSLPSLTPRTDAVNVNPGSTTSGTLIETTFCADAVLANRIAKKKSRILISFRLRLSITLR